jgi:CheY-like chemotaxis protein
MNRSDVIRVLVVDDEPYQLELTKLGLEGQGDFFNIKTASSGTEALDVIRNSFLDCIICDYSMPDMNGLELCRKVRAERYTVPFILYTGRGSEEIASQAFAAGADGYVRKGKNLSFYTLLSNNIQNHVRAPAK